MQTKYDKVNDQNQSYTQITKRKTNDNNWQKINSYLMNDIDIDNDKSWT